MFRKKGKLAVKVEICIEKDEDRFYAYCPALKGIHIDGDTETEAVQNIKEAISLYILSLLKHGDPIPITITNTEAPTSRSKESCLQERRRMEDVLIESVSLAM
jgi:predicted RNase H-like HicB family nuclease